MAQRKAIREPEELYACQAVYETWDYRTTSMHLTTPMHLAEKVAQASLPGAEQTPQQNQLAEVIGIVVGHQQGFAKQRLSVAMRNRSEKIIGRVFDKLFHFGRVPAERRDTRVPRRRIGGSIALGPVALRPLRRFMLGVAAEFKNVPLSDAQVLEEPPWRERQIFHASRAESRRQAFYGLVEIRMSLPAAQQFNQVLPERGLK